MQPELSFYDLEVGSFELMPSIYRALLAAESTAPLMGRLKGIYRKSWVVSTMLLEKTKSLSEAFDAGDVRAVFLAGPVTGFRYYADTASRYSPVLEVLVGRDDRDRAASILARTGWTERNEPVHASDQRLFSSREGGSLSIRTRVAPDFGQGEIAVDFPPESTERFLMDGIAVRVPTPTESLLHVCATGARVGPTPDIQWLADAAMIVRTGQVDWDRLVDRGVATHQVSRLVETLSYLAALPGPHAPEAVARSLARQPVSLRERTSYRLASGGPSIFGALPTILAGHLAETRDRPLIHTFALLPAHLRDQWGLGHVWQLPGALARRTARKLRRVDAVERIDR